MRIIHLTAALLLLVFLADADAASVTAGKAVLSYTVPDGYVEAEGLKYEAEFAGTGASMNPDVGILAAYVPADVDKAFRAAKEGALERCLLIATPSDPLPGMERTFAALRPWFADPEFFRETYMNEAKRIAVPGLTRKVTDYTLRAFHENGPGEFSILYTMAMESAVGSGRMLTYGVYETMFLVEGTLFAVQQTQVLHGERDVVSFGREAAEILAKMRFFGAAP